MKCCSQLQFNRDSLLLRLDSAVETPACWFITVLYKVLKPQQLPSNYSDHLRNNMARPMPLQVSGLSSNVFKVYLPKKGYYMGQG